MNAIAFEQISVESSENPQTKAITVLRDTLDAGSSSQVGETLTYGNLHALKFLDDLEEISLRGKR